MEIREIIKHIFEMAPNPEGMKENDYLCGDGSNDVSGIGVAWWITSEILQDMSNNGLNLGLCHEPILFEGLESKPFVWGPTPDEKDFKPNIKINAILRKTRITVHRFHSNLDKAPFGMVPALLKRLEWENYPIRYAGDVPLVTLPRKPLKDLALELKSKLNLPYVKFDGKPERTVSNAVILWGGLCQFWGGPMCASLLEPDVIIGGDIIDGVVRICHENGWAVIDALHCATEMDGMKALTRMLQQRYPDLTVRFYPNPIPFPNIV